MCIPLRHKFIQVFLEQLSKCKSKSISIYKATYVCCMKLQLFNVYLSITLDLSYSPSDWRPFNSRLQSVAQLITNPPYTSQSTNWSCNWDHQASILCNVFSFINRNSNFLTMLAVEGPYIKLIEPHKQSFWSRWKAIWILATPQFSVPWSARTNLAKNMSIRSKATTNVKVYSANNSWHDIVEMRLSDWQLLVHHNRWKEVLSRNVQY